MPFTLSHAVVALPFRSSRLPAAGVAAGAMVPDLPLGPQPPEAPRAA